MDYEKYCFTKKEWIWNLGLFLGLAAVIAYLFYRSWIAFALCLPLVGVFVKKRKEALCKRRQEELEQQFLVGMEAVSTALTAGYSVETAFQDAYRELQNIYGMEDMIMIEFRYIVSQLRMNRSLEELLLSLADRSGVEDIRNFAEIFSAAKRTGGNLIAIIRNTVWNIGQREETKREITTVLSAKKLEQNIMSLVPAMILFYVELVSPGFLEVMYHNILGVFIMSICLGVYGAAWAWGRKIVDIEV